MNFINNETARNPDFVAQHQADICASIQHTIIEMLTDNLQKAVAQTGITNIAIAGGVSANSCLRVTLQNLSAQEGWQLYIPTFEYCTDNAAMIAMAGYQKFLKNDFVGQGVAPLPRYAV